MGSLCVTQRAQTSAMLGWDGVGSGREIQEGGDICILMADSCCHMAEPTQHCKAIILQIKFKKRNQWYFEYGTMNVGLYMQLYILWKYFCNYM